ncbi:hypothetical protein ACFWQK_11075 [Brachybacterium paraconglomeratum]
MTAVPERPAWLATEEELAEMAPAPLVTPARKRRWAKVFHWQADEAAEAEELPKVMRLWFAAVARCDSEGRADFNSGELAEFFGCSGRTVRSVIAQGKAGGVFGEGSDARHVYLTGALDESPSAKRTAKRRRLDAIGQRHGSTRPRKKAA